MKSRYVIFTFAVLALTVVTPATQAVFAQEKPQKIGGLTRLAISQIESATGFKFAVKRVEGSLFGKIILRNGTIRDRKGVFASFSLLSLDWSPGGILNGDIKINELALEDLLIKRKPLQPPAKAKPFDLGIFNLGFSQPLDLFFEKLRIDRVKVAAGVLGKDALAFNIAGRFILPRSRKSAHISLRLNKTAGAGPDGVIHAVLNEKTGVLSIKTLISEAANGIVGNLLGLKNKDALKVSLNGEGPVKSWSGRFIADGGEAASVRLGIRVSDKGSTINLKGTAASAILAEKYSSLGDTLNFDVSLSLPDDDRIVLKKLDLSSSIGDLRASGTLYPKDNRLNLDLAGYLSDLTLLRPFTGLSLTGQGSVRLNIKGTPTEPVMGLAVVARDASVAQFETRKLLLSAVIKPKLAVTTAKDGNEKPKTITSRVVDLSLAAEGTRVRGPEAVDRILNAVSIAVRGSFDTEKLTGQIEKLEAVLDKAKLTASGALLSSSPLAFDGKIRFQGTLLPDLLNGAKIVDADIGGSILVDLKARTGKLKFVGKAAELETQKPNIDRFLSGSFGFALDTQWSDKTVTIGAFSLKNKSLTISAKGTLSSDKPGQFKLNANIPDLARFSGIAGAPVVGSLTVAADVTGDGRKIDGKIHLNGKAIQYTGQNLGNLDVTISGKDLIGRPNAKVSVTLSKGDFDGKVAAAIQQIAKNVYRFAGLNIDAAGVRASGSGRYDASKKRFSGKLKARIKDLQRLAKPLGVNASGGLRISVSSSTTSTGTQRASLTFRGSGLRYRSGSDAFAANRIRGTVSVGNLETFAGLSGRINGIGIATGGTRLQNLVARFRSLRDGRSGFSVQTRLQNGQNIIPISVGGAARIGKVQTDIFLNRLSLRYAGIPVRLVRGGRVRIAGESLTLSPLLFDVSGGRVGISLRKRGAVLAGRVKISGLPARLASAVGYRQLLRGTISGTASVRGSAAHPRIRFTIAGRKLRRRRAPLRAALSVDAKGWWSPGAIRVNATVTSKNVRDRLVVNARLLGRSLRASLKGQIGLGVVSDSGLVWSHRATGRLNTDLDIQGSAAAPRARGTVTLTNGRFLNAQTGAIFDKIKLRLVGSGTKIRVVEGSATDGGRGRLTVAGWVDVNAGRGYPVDLTVSTTSAKLYRLEEVQATITSRLRLQGALLRTLNAGGKITIDNADILIPSGGGEKHHYS